MEVFFLLSVDFRVMLNRSLCCIVSLLIQILNKFHIVICVVTIKKRGQTIKYQIIITSSTNWYDIITWVKWKYSSVHMIYFYYFILFIQLIKLWVQLIKIIKSLVLENKEFDVQNLLIRIERDRVNVWQNKNKYMLH